MEMHRHIQPSAFGGDEAENVVLQRAVIAGAGGVDFFGVGFRRIADGKRTQVRHLEFLGDGAAVLLAQKRRFDHLFQILVERGQLRRHAGFSVVSRQKFGFQREELFLIGIVDQRAGG